MHGPGDPAASFSRPASAHGARAWTPPSAEEVKRLLPDYEVLSLVGHGGMGAVYLAMQAALDRSVAIKLMPLEASADETFAKRFAREARAMARLNHPHITAVFDSGKTSAGHLYFAMEFVDGANLQTMIREPGLAPAQALEIAAQVCAALTYAHANGIVHRDIKPANVLVDRDGQAKVADFGIARFAEPGAYHATQTGMFLGTPDYMAPEQIRDARVDHRADLYSLGVMLYEMLCGEVPRGMFAPPSRRVACGKRTDAVVARAMQQDPALRYQSAADMQADLEAARLRLPRDPSNKSRLPRYAAITLTLAAIAAVPLLLRHPSDHPKAHPNPAPNPASWVARTPEAGWTDLLAGVDVQRDSILGQWRKENGELISPGLHTHCTIEVPVENIPDEYDLRYRLTRRLLGSALFFGLRAGDRAGGVEFDAWTGNRAVSNEVAVKLLGGAGGKTEMATRAGVYFDAMTPHELLIQVRRDRLAVILDGKQLAEFPGGLVSKITSKRGDHVDPAFFPEDIYPSPRFVVGVCDGEAVVHSIEMKVLD